MFIACITGKKKAHPGRITSLDLDRKTSPSSLSSGASPSAKRAEGASLGWNSHPQPGRLRKGGQLKTRTDASPALSCTSPATTGAKPGPYLQLVPPLRLDGADDPHHALQLPDAHRGFLQLGHLQVETPPLLSDAPGFPHSSWGTDAVLLSILAVFPASSCPGAVLPQPCSTRTLLPRAVLPKPCSLGISLCSPITGRFPSPVHAPYNPGRGSRSPRSHHRAPLREGPRGGGAAQPREEPEPERGGSGGGTGGGTGGRPGSAPSASWYRHLRSRFFCNALRARKAKEKGLNQPNK